MKILVFFKLLNLEIYFLLFKKSFDIINDKKHLSIEGLHELISIRASLNKSLPDRLKLAFQYIKPVIRPEVPKFYTSTDPALPSHKCDLDLSAIKH
jgi:hypothetical protein